VAATIEVEGLTKSFGSFRAVDDISFVAEDGKITALLGPSGSGKSTALRMIAGLERPDAGRITLAGEDQTEASVQERRIGFVFQHYALFRHMTVRQNVSFGLKVRKEPKGDTARRVDELLELVQLAPFADRYPGNLSGGQRQRVALARALAPRPKVLLLDEPFGALDARVRQELRRWLDDLHRELGVTSLLVTHDQDEALELANKIVVMHNGRIEQTGTPDEIYNHPASPFVAGFIGAANVITGSVRDGHLEFGEHLLPGAHHIDDGVAAHAYIRPLDIRIVDQAHANGHSHSATVERVNNLGPVSKVRFRLSDGQPLVGELSNEDLPVLSAGDHVLLDLRNVKVFEGAAEHAPGAIASGTGNDAVVEDK
jgi:sulfate/thiosulfate transport system ATP-binding protein